MDAFAVSLRPMSASRSSLVVALLLVSNALGHRPADEWALARDRSYARTARERAVGTLRLDSGSHLTEAQQLYARTGYREVPAFSNGRFSDRWYEKSLD